MGALIFAVYPLSVARAHDVFEGKRTVAVSACLLLSYSIGASISPLLASVTMDLLKTPFGLFAYWSSVNGVFALIGVYLLKQEKVAKVAIEDQVQLVAPGRSPRRSWRGRGKDGVFTPPGNRSN